MGMAQGTQDKRSIRVKDFLDDFRSGMSDDGLVDKYNLTRTGLDRFYGLLLDRQILAPHELEGRDPIRDDYDDPADAAIDVKSRLICPKCQAVHQQDRDSCSECGTALALGAEAVAGGAAPFPEALLINADHSEPEEKEASQPVQAKPLKKDLFDSAQGANPSRPIEIPLIEDPEPVRPANHGAEEPELVRVDRFDAPFVGYDDSAEEVVPGMPLQFGDADKADGKTQGKCPACNEILDSSVRKVYDAKWALLALAASAAFLLLGCGGAAALTFIEGYSPLRLAVIYATAVGLLTGSALLALALHMLLFAREKAYVCHGCDRAYPRL
jgi:hypothetical protein